MEDKTNNKKYNKKWVVYSEVEYFFDGSKSAEAVASVLQNKVFLYLNE